MCVVCDTVLDAWEASGVYLSPSASGEACEKLL